MKWSLSPSFHQPQPPSPCWKSYSRSSPCLRHLVELLEIPLAFGCVLSACCVLDAAEQPVPIDRLGLEAEVVQRLGRDHRRQEAAHRLLGAAVGIVDQVGQRVEHRHGQARRDLHVQLRRLGFALGGQVERDRDVIAAHLAGFAK